MNRGVVAGVAEEDEAVAAAADGAQPVIVGMPDELVEKALLVALEFADPLAAAPVVDLDARRAGQPIDVADLADAADGDLRAVGREGERADAADRADALHAV